MSLRLTEQNTVRFMEKARLEWIPRWHLYPTMIIVGPFNTQEERSEHYGKTIGSGGDSHEFRFGRESRILESITMFVQLRDVVTSPEKMSAYWRTAPLLKGTLEYVGADDYFSVPVEDMYFWLDPYGSSLICMMSPDIEQDAENLRLEVAPDFECLFCQQKLCGWKLLDPVSHIVDNYDAPRPIKVGEELLVEIVREYLRLTAASSFDRVDTHDPGFLRECLALRDRLRKNRNSAYHTTVIRHAIEEIVEFFYQWIDDAELIE